MPQVLLIVGFGLPLLACAALFGILCVLKGRLRKTQNQLQEERIQNHTLQERLNLYSDIQEHVKNHIKVTCNESLEKGLATLLERSGQLLQGFRQENTQTLSSQKNHLSSVLSPLEKALSSVQKHIFELEQRREGAYQGLTAEIKGLKDAQGALQNETMRLSKALKSPNIQGQWGELQLRRLVEWCGMVPFCDFLDQKTFSAEETTMRPDLVITLPGERSIVVDAKAPLSGLLEDAGGQADKRKQQKEVAKNLKSHVLSLSRKNYAAYIKNSPDFVLLFLPTESLLLAALEGDETLINYCTEKSVLLATPMTLIALLKMVALGWRQEALNQNTKKIGSLSTSLVKHMRQFLEKMKKLGQGLDASTLAYNHLIQEAQSKIVPASDEIASLSGQQAETLDNISLKKISKKTA